jgi:hypothetical protein
MRVALPLALVFALAGAVEAQQPQQSADVTQNVEIAAPAAALSSTVAPASGAVLPAAAAAQDASADQAAVGSTDVESEARSADTEEAVRQDPSTRQWWWLVGAIVVAGIILAVLR